MIYKVDESYGIKRRDSYWSRLDWENRIWKGYDTASHIKRYCMQECVNWDLERIMAAVESLAVKVPRVAMRNEESFLNWINNLTDEDFK